VGLIEPQFDWLHVTFQLTPKFELSLVTVALTMAWADMRMKAGGAWVNAIEIGTVIATVAETILVGSAVEVAVIVTVLPGGTEPGAVKVVRAPLAV
jgi:hypothetical protein